MQHFASLKRMGQFSDLHEASIRYLSSHCAFNIALIINHCDKPTDYWCGTCL